jgi:hypothetical protein
METNFERRRRQHMSGLKKKQWTVMVWMAGDNNLEDAGVDDLQELKKVGSTDDIDILVQLDRMSAGQTRRYHVRKETTAEEDMVEELGETNTGDPQCAIDFFTWGIQNHPANHYLVVLWNHGSGIDETNIYRRMSQLGLNTTESRAQSRVRAVMKHGYHRSLFTTTLDAALRDRAIAYDDTSRDFLDNMELKKVLEEVKKKTGRKIDLVGFDACLMNMFELAYELRGVANFVVGSEETEPGDGWPYDTILADLAAKPAMSARELGSVIVRRFVESYPTDNVTQSLLDLNLAPVVAQAVDALAVVLLQLIEKPEGFFAINKALKATQAYDVRDFIDLGDLIKQLLLQLKKISPAVQQELIELLKKEPDILHPFVAAEAHQGKKVAHSTGVTIYCPVQRTDVSVCYDRLAFAKKTRWDDFIKAYA